MSTEDKTLTRDERYDAQSVESKWFDRWQQDPALYSAESASTKPKYYVLEMLPYPSGALHMGHVRNYAIGDALARYMWMRGYNVLHPMGWDAFGLACGECRDQEQHASRASGRSPTSRNMKAQMERLGLSYDWSREVTTCLPDYYRWNQWFFLQDVRARPGLPQEEQGELVSGVRTVLANEQVVDGCCWRHEDTLVEQRELEQWFLRITEYADELLDDLDEARGLAGESAHHAAQLDRPQRRARRSTSLGGSVGRRPDRRSRVFTTRIDTIFGATSLQLAPEHPLVADMVAKNPDLRSKVGKLHRTSSGRPRRSATWRDRKARCLHRPVRHQSVQRRALPIWVANYILMDYGTGAIMSVPAHDERDFEFAKKYDCRFASSFFPAAEMRRNEWIRRCRSRPRTACW